MIASCDLFFRCIIFELLLQFDSLSDSSIWLGGALGRRVFDGGDTCRHENGMAGQQQPGETYTCQASADVHVHQSINHQGVFYTSV